MENEQYTTIWSFLDAGGVIMYPIGLAAVIGLAILIERIVALRPGRIVPQAFAIECRDLIRRGRFEDAEILCRKNTSPAARLSVTALENRNRRRQEIKERVEEAGRQEAAELERYTSALGTVAQAAPLLGLLGTVLGMIRTFDDIRAQAVDYAQSNLLMVDVAGGISEALITTMAGLSVGIPALVAYRWILTVVDERVLDLEALSSRILDQLEVDAEESVEGRGES